MLKRISLSGLMVLAAVNAHAMDWDLNYLNVDAWSRRTKVAKPCVAMPVVLAAAKRPQALKLYCVETSVVKSAKPVEPAGKPAAAEARVQLAPAKKEEKKSWFGKCLDFGLTYIVPAVFEIGRIVPPATEDAAPTFVQNPHMLRDGARAVAEAVVVNSSVDFIGGVSKGLTGHNILDCPWSTQEHPNVCAVETTAVRIAMSMIIGMGVNKTTDAAFGMPFSRTPAQ